MLVLVLCDYLFGRVIASTDKEKKGLRKFLLVWALTVNLGLLAWFKYVGFFAESVNFLIGTSLPVIKPLMPVGISFFTFQTLTYVIDVYREDAECQRSYLKLLMYVSLFPQLIAGPIVRYKDVEAQLNHRTVTAEDMNDGIFRFCVGLGKKVLIADSCDAVLLSLIGLEPVTVLARIAAAAVFTLQLYFDFSGYSDMAIGLGRMFGFTFPENFRHPLASGSATDFWRRWHITLGSFFRDYVYIPMGGGRSHRMRNILVVWFLTGLWHGASWNFAIWGLYYAVILIMEKAFLLKAFDRLPKILSFPLSHIYTVIIAVFGFAIFYFDSDLMTNLGYIFGVGTSGFSDIFTLSILSDNVFLLSAAAILAFPVIPKLGELVENALPESSRYQLKRIFCTVAALALLAVCTVRLVGNTYSPFLYFRF